MRRRVLAVVPSRYASTRFPRKALAPIAGVPLVVRVAVQAGKSTEVDEVVVATDSEEIRAVVEEAGLTAMMTSSAHVSGTDRVREVADKLGLTNELVVNVQGDEPLIAPEDLDALVSEARAHDYPMATLQRPLKNASDLFDPNVVKVVTNAQGRALYFSRAPIPNSSAEAARAHVGVYLYRADVLKKLAALAPTELERTERLEQLRALENDIPVFVVDARSRTPSIAVDVPEDVERVEAALLASNGGG